MNPFNVLVKTIFNPINGLVYTQYSKLYVVAPCFGCTCMEVEKAIECQGRTPWLEVLEAEDTLARLEEEAS